MRKLEKITLVCCLNAMVLSMALSSYTSPLTPEQVEALRGCLEEHGFEFGEKPYAFFSARRGKLNVIAYEKGPKILVQGKETEEFVKFILEPEVLGEAKLGYEEVWQADMFEPHFGVDESGKGDFFGPLVVAGVYTNREQARELLDAGIMDSKRIGSANRIRVLSAEIREIVRGGAKIIRWAPSRYNKLYGQFRSINRLLAWGHASVIEDLQRRVPNCPRALSDQFARPEVLESALKKREVEIVLDQRTKAESDVAVAAASILARESFLDWIEKTSEKCGIELPLGANDRVKQAGRQFIMKYGEERLGEVAKLHFKTSQEL